MVVDEVDAQEWSTAAFIDAAEHGRLDAVVERWASITDADGADDAGWTALLAAVGKGHVDVAQFLLECGASTASRTPQSLTPLHLAASNGDVAMIKLLCRFGANVDAHGPHGRTALHLALQLHYSLVASALLDHGASAGAVDDDGNTVFMRACVTRHAEFVSQVVEKMDHAGATEAKHQLVNKPGQDAWTPLLVAAAHGDVRLATLLVRHGAQLEQKNADGFSPLFCAARMCHEEVVRFLLASGADTETTDSEGSTPLLIAATLGFGPIVTMLLERGANMKQSSSNGFSALHVSASGGHATIVASLLDHGADPNSRQKEGWTPLLLAADQGLVEVVRLLLERGAEVNCQSYDQWTALTIATQHGHVSVSKLLLERGASMDCRTQQSLTPLHVAATTGNTEMLDLLCRFGADINAHGPLGGTALHLALALNLPEVVAFLLDHAATPNAVDDDGQTVLMHACWAGKEDFAIQIVEKLDDDGATDAKRELVNQPRTIDNSTPLHVAAELGHLNLVVFLLHHGAELETKNVDGLSPLNSAVLEGHDGVAQFLLANGADTDTTDVEADTPLVIASKRGFGSIVGTLLEYGAKVDHTGANGDSALYCAAVEGHVAVVQLLLEHGASREIRQGEGRTPLAGAAQRGHLEVVCLLSENGADLNCWSKDHTTPLIAAGKSGQVAVCEELLRRGALTTLQTTDGQTALHAAAIAGNVEMLDLLCRFGADVDARGRHGTTALHVAVKLDLEHVVAFLLDQGAAVHAVDDRGVTAFMRACLEGNEALVVQMVKKLDDAGATETKRTLVNQPVGPLNVTPLLVAAARGHFGLVKILVLHGAEVEITNAEGHSPLQRATASGHKDIVQFLLVSGADTETTDLEGSTPLMLATQVGLGVIVEMLLEHGANANHTGIRGFTALHHAAAEGHTRLVELLLRNGADPEVREQNGLGTPLLLATDRGHREIIRLLIDHGVDIDCQGNDHWTPLIVAAKNGHTAICALLLARGASTTLQTTFGRTALHVAASIDQREIIGMLLEAGADPKTRDYRARTAAYDAMMEGYFSTAELLEQVSRTTEGESDGEVWPRHSLCELYGVSRTCERGAETLRQDPPWYIDRSSVASIEPCPHLTTSAAEVAVGTWSGSRVLVVKPLTALVQPRFVGNLMEQNFRREVSNLYPLRHPHVIKLYGACHRGGRPFLVMEHPQSGKTLRSVVGEHKHRTWAILHQVALGVQYLHERGFVHCSLTGGNILIGDDGLAKLSAFGLYTMSVVDDSAFLWMPSEVLDGDDPQFESDVYSLGMTIVEAVSGELPYAYEASENQNVKDLIARGRPPRKPAGFSPQGWELVMKMICFQNEKRLRIADVVRELAAFAQEEARKSHDLHRAAYSIDTRFDMEEALEITRSLLSGQELAGTNDPQTDTPQHQVFLRLYAVWQASNCLPPTSLQLVLPRIHDILARFTNHLEARAGPAASFAARRQHSEHVLSFHNEIDRLVDQHRELQQTHSGSPITIAPQSWREQGYAHRRRELEAFGDSLKHVDELDVETCTCLLYELTQRRDAYTSISPEDIHSACGTMHSKPGVHVPNWFIPHYEVAFDAFQSFSRGAFGSVHHGEWMGARVVIKKVFADDDDVEFEKEVAIWSQLYHPHVLQLFGACHVGQKFLVSEFAAQGQLDRYLHRLEKQPTGRTREVWRTLYEAALGLQYLHTRGIVHCDLKCNNILVGRDGKAKVSDYGLSRRQEQQQELDHAASPHNATDHEEHESPNDSQVTTRPTTHVGAPRWKAPEVLNGAEPTVESDVYSFGMCVVEAVSGEYPWGMKDRDELVSDHVRRGGHLFEKPRGFRDAQWGLVVDACRFDPKDRLRLSEIVAQLEAFADEASASEDGVTNSELDDVGEPEPETKTVWSNSDSAVFSEVVLPVAVDSAAIGVRSTSAPGTNYEESW